MATITPAPKVAATATSKADTAKQAEEVKNSLLVATSTPVDALDLDDLELSSGTKFVLSQDASSRV